MTLSEELDLADDILARNDDPERARIEMTLANISPSFIGPVIARHYYGWKGDGAEGEREEKKSHIE